MKTRTGLVLDDWFMGVGMPGEIEGFAYCEHVFEIDSQTLWLWQRAFGME